MEKQRDRKKIGHFSQEKLHLFFFFFQRSKGGGWLHAALSLLIEWEDFIFFLCSSRAGSILAAFLKNKILSLCK